VTGTESFEDAYFSGDVEIVRTPAETRLGHRLRRPAERARAVRNDTDAVQTFIDRRRVIQGKRAALKPKTFGKRYQLRVRPAGQDRHESHGSGPLGDQLSRVSIGAVDEDVCHEYSTI
jgi:hypothetical protein